MNALKNIIVFIWGLSIALFFVILLSAYYYMPSEVAISFNSDNLASSYLNKEHLYYYITAGIFIFNVVGAVLATLVEKFPYKGLQVPKKDWWLDGGYNEEAFRIIARNWVFVLVTFINAMMMTVLVQFWKANGERGAAALTAFDWLLPAMGVILMVTLAFPFVRFNFKTYFSDRHID